MAAASCLFSVHLMLAEWPDNPGAPPRSGPDGRNGMRRCPDGTGSSGTAAVRGRRGMAQVRQRCGMPPGMAKGISANGE